MAASDQDQVLNILLIGQTQANALGQPLSVVLYAMVAAIGPEYTSGGSRAISASVNGKSFSFQVDPKLNATDLATAIRLALGYAANYTAEEIDALLFPPPSSGYGRVGFAGHLPRFFWY